MASENTEKELVVAKRDNSPQIWMAKGEYTNVIVSAKQSCGEYVISEGIIKPESFIPEHYHKWEEQTFHVLEGEVEAKIGNEVYTLQVGDSVHCPRGITHYMKNNGTRTVRLLSYIFPGTWAEAYFEETSRQNHEGVHDHNLVEEKFGVVYS